MSLCSSLKYMSFIVVCLLLFGSCRSHEVKAEHNLAAIDTDTIDLQTTVPVSASSSERQKNKIKKIRETVDPVPVKKHIDIPYTVLARGSNRLVETMIIRSKEAMDKLTQQRCDISELQLKAFSNINFDKQALVIAHAGTFNTGGYSIDLQSAVFEDACLHLIFTVDAPKPTDLVTQAFTYPYIALVVDVDKTMNITLEILGAHTRNERSRF